LHTKKEVSRTRLSNGIGTVGSHSIHYMWIWGMIFPADHLTGAKNEV